MRIRTASTKRDAAPRGAAIAHLLLVSSLLALGGCATSLDARVTPAAPAAPAASADADRVRVKVAEVRIPTGNGTVTSGPRSGLVYESDDGTQRFHLGGVGRVDAVRYGSDNTRDNGLEIEQAIVRFEARVDELLSARIGIDLHGIDTEYGLREAWVGRRDDRGARWRFGLIESSLGFEGGFFEEDLPFGRFGYTSSVVEQADWGVVVDGSTGEGVLEYELGVGVGEGYSLYGDTRDSPRATARFVARPLASSGLALAVPGAALPLGGLFAGFGAAWSPEYRGDFTVVTPMRNELFQVKDLRAEEARFFHATAGWDVGPVRLVYETIFGEVFEQWFGSGSGFFDVDTPTGKQDFDEVGTWEAGISWAVTGQHYDSRAMAKETAGGFVPSEPKYRGGKKSRRGDGDDDEDDGFEDVVELWFRYSNADIDRAFFDAGLADFDVSSQEFRTAAFGAHWRPSRNVRLSAGVARTIADQTPAQFGGDDRDTSAFLSLSYRF